MAIQASVAVRNAKLDAVESAIGASAVMKIFSGAAPANCAAADAGTVLATLNLPADWMAAAANGSKAKLGTWDDNSADNAGTAAHFRIYQNDESVCHLQGTVSASGGGGDMIVDNISFAAGQTFTVSGFSLSEGNA